jgi:MBG domain (YGX type)
MRAAGEDVGSYAIGQGTLSLGSNYDLTFIGAHLTITPRPITVTADAQSKVYGEAGPALTYQITDGFLAFSDAFTGHLTRVAGEGVGSYAIQQGTLTLRGNYALTYVGSNLTITKATLTVTADNKSMVYGAANPTFTASYGGFKNGETPGTSGVTGSPSLTTTATTTSPVDAYTITSALGTLASGNYSFSFVNGTLTIGAWTVNGFYQPVDMNGVVNICKVGSTVPLKFQVFAGGTELTDTSIVKSIGYKEVPAGASATTDDLETYATGGTSLRYDATAHQFVYNFNFSTKTFVAGKTYQITIMLQDGTTISALFKMK